MKRIGIDTNVLLRLLVNDDPEQRAAAMKFGSKLNIDYVGVVSLISLVEMDWALRTQYRYGRKQSTEAIGKIIRIRGVEIEYHDVVVGALRLVEGNNADFADALIGCRLAEMGCETIVSFNRRAAKSVPGMELLS